jgi:hypothetical protein
MGSSILTPMFVDGFWILQTTNTLTGGAKILATAQDEDGDGIHSTEEPG